MKKVWLGLALALLISASLTQAAKAGVPFGGTGSTDCVGYCQSNGITHHNVPGQIDEFAREHNPTGDNGHTECGKVSGDKTIPDLPPPQP